MIHFLPFFSVRKSNSAVDESRITSENRQPLSPKPAIKKKTATPFEKSSFPRYHFYVYRSDRQDETAKRHVSM